MNGGDYCRCPGCGLCEAAEAARRKPCKPRQHNAKARAEIDRLRHEISTLRDALRGDPESVVLRGVVADHLDIILQGES